MKYLQKEIFQVGLSEKQKKKLKHNNRNRL
jgi:hypothetical protein